MIKDQLLIRSFFNFSLKLKISFQTFHYFVRFAFPEFSGLFFHIPVVGTPELNTAYAEVTSLLLLDILLVSSSVDMSWTFCPPDPGVCFAASCPPLAAQPYLLQSRPSLVDHPLTQSIWCRVGYPDPAPILKGVQGNWEEQVLEIQQQLNEWTSTPLPGSGGDE